MISWDTPIARRAATLARHADVVLFSAHEHRELPAHVQAWLEEWLNRRPNPEGVLTALIGSPAGSARSLAPVHVYLQEAARQAHMVFIPQELESLPESADCSIEAIEARALQTSSVLEAILHHHGRPTWPHDLMAEAATESQRRPFRYATSWS